MKTGMLKLLNFQEVMVKIDENEISDEDFLNMNFDTIRISHGLTITGMRKVEEKGEKFDVPEFQPLNAFAESFGETIRMRAAGILYCHFGNEGLRDYYDHVLNEITGKQNQEEPRIVRPNDDGIVVPR